jgi:hypothetical protein
MMLPLMVLMLNMKMIMMQLLIIATMHLLMVMIRGVNRNRCVWKD